MYYEQALAQLLSQGSFTLLSVYITDIFNLSITNSSRSDTDNGWCFMNGLTSKDKIFTDLLTPTMVFLMIVILFAMSKCRKTGIITYFSKRQINFKNTFTSMVLLLIGNVLSVLFKLLNCQQVGKSTYHFYFAYEYCYGSTWWISLALLTLIIFIFSFIFFRLWRMSSSYRQNKDQPLYIIYIEI